MGDWGRGEVTAESRADGTPIREFSIIDASDADEDAAALAKSISFAWPRMRLNRSQPFVLRLLTEGMGLPELLE
jgi:hypothetical protein